MSYKENMRSKINKIRKMVQEKLTLIKSPGEGEMQSAFKWDTFGGVSLDSCLGSGHEKCWKPRSGDTD